MLPLKLYRCLMEGGVALTANRRLAAVWREYYDVYQISQNNVAWISGDILSLDAWIIRLWEKVEDNRFVLTSFQEQCIWEKIIKDSPSGAELLNIKETAKSVQQGWRLLQECEISLPMLETQEKTLETTAFTLWAKEFLKQSEQENWIDKSRLLSLLIPHLKKIHLPSEIILVDFDEEIPLQTKTFFKALRENKISITSWQEEQVTKMTQRAEIPTIEKTQVAIACQDLEEEFYMMACWAKEKLKNAPEAKIACVVPQLASVRDEVEHIFKEVFGEEKWYNISMGKVLNIFPLIKHALLILKQGYSLQMLSEMSRFIRSPFLKGAFSEQFARANLDKKLRDRGEFHAELMEIIHLGNEKDKNHYCPIMVEILKALLATRKNNLFKKLPSQWILEWDTCLTIAGWPGKVDLDSQTYQLLERWKKLLAEFASLDRIIGKLTFGVALEKLQQMVCDIIFQKESQQEPIQILGVLEASGLPFDYLWISGLDEEAWPLRGYPHPFIPLSLQRRYRMLHVYAEDDFKFYQGLLERFFHYSPQVICSYAKSKEEKTLRLTPLLKKLPLLSTASLGIPEFQKKAKVLFLERKIEHVVENDLLALGEEERLKIRGGSSLLKDQSACSFRAFARFRLGAIAMNNLHLGLTPRDRGKLVHKVLENLWDTLKDKATLDQFSQQALENVISEIIDSVLKAYNFKKPHTLKRHFSAIEKVRLKKLLLTWLSEEKKRLSFTVIAKEHIQKFLIKNIPLQLRIDRIDKLSDDSYVLIDYKTNKTSLHEWWGERPDDPQIPLYFMAQSAEREKNEKSITAISYAEIRFDQPRFNGISREREILPFSERRGEKHILQDWSHLKLQWEESLNQLAEDFQKGVIKKNPKYGEETCTHCDFKILCRIHEVKA